MKDVNIEIKLKVCQTNETKFRQYRQNIQCLKNVNQVHTYVVLLYYNHASLSLNKI